MKFIETLASYLPTTILSHLLREDTLVPIIDDFGKLKAARQSFETVCMFCGMNVQERPVNFYEDFEFNLTIYLIK